jgi:hypothetical protein
MDPPPIPSEFLIPTGKFASRAMIGYPFAVPNDESLFLSAYRMKATSLSFWGALLGGIRLWITSRSKHYYYSKSMRVVYLRFPPSIA